MLNPIGCILDNVLLPKNLTILGFLRDINIVKRLSENSSVMMGKSRKETFSECNEKDILQTIYWVHDNFVNVDKNITFNLVVVDNPQDSEIACEISIRYQIPLIVAFSPQQWSNIRHMDRLLIQEKFPKFATCIMFAQDKTSNLNLPQLLPYTTVLSQEHLVDILTKTAKQPVIL